MSLLLLLLNDAFFAAIPAIGFAMLFNVPKRFLIFCAIAGAIGHCARTVMLRYGLPIEWATFVAAALIGVITIAFAKRHLAPPLLYAVAAIIPMIPGSYAFNTVIAIVKLTASHSLQPELLNSAVTNGLKTIFILGALSVGLAMPALVYYRTRPII
ncbi:membrane protein [Shewanella mangrovi]|uniref:Membrane protein n=1 Tax=Shewanella mangrovi TaxID=1515746 RepID=A0A094JME3_9GAMM|nr:threonine/serine exporter family protein [Shewanella mangrovi]KFZ39224.1 membrane protein [Shewanella mangrovi]